MTSRELKDIHNTKNSCRAYFYVQHTKTTLVFLPADRKAYLQVRSPYYETAQCNQKTPIPVSQGDMWGVRKPKKDKHQLVTATTNVHLPKSISTDLTIKSDSILTNPIRKDEVAGRLI